MSEAPKKPKVIFCTPSLQGPTAPYIKGLEDSIPLITGAGWDEGYAQDIGCPYISAARATMTRRALDQKPDVLIYLDYDLSWRPTDLLKLLVTEGDVVAGTYRYKKDEEQYMGTVVCKADGRPVMRNDGAMAAELVPAGFLKITLNGIRQFMRAYPELQYGDPERPAIDLFNHGAADGIWWGEDYAFCRRWKKIGGLIWLIPDLSITHWSGDTPFPGNFQDFLLQQKS